MNIELAKNSGYLSSLVLGIVGYMKHFQMQVVPAYYDGESKAAAASAFLGATPHLTAAGAVI